MHWRELLAFETRKGLPLVCARRGKEIGLDRLLARGPSVSGLNAGLGVLEIVD